MKLTALDKKIFDKIINNHLKMAKNSYEFFSNSDIKKIHGIKNVKEFVFGTLYESIILSFKNYLDVAYPDNTYRDLLEEIPEILVIRLPEIKKYIN